jgi:two-component system, chemotaxis family, chemotaxis protein CheY
MTSFLVVDDSKILRQHMIELLSNLGFSDIENAINGQDALDKIQKRMPDIITLDWNMPVMDGLSFLKALRRLPNGKQAKVIFCTSEGRNTKMVAAFENGADEYIVKPVELPALRERLMLLGVIA